MPFLSRLANLIRNLARGHQAERELDQEVRSYLEMLTQENVRAGMTAQTARRAAMIELGGLEQVKEEVRDVKLGRLLEDLLQDLSYGLRQIRRNPGFALVAVLTLALGIGANTAIFSVLNAVLLRALPYAHARQLVILWETNRSRARIQVSNLDFQDWRSQSHMFSQMAEYTDSGPVPMAGVGAPLRVYASAVSAGFFKILGVEAQSGRTFSPAEHKSGAPAAVVVSDSLWRHHFGSDPGILGKTLDLDGKSFRVVGVMAAGFDFPARNDVWVPVELFGDDSARGAHNYRVIARLKPGATVEGAQAQMSALAARLSVEYPDSNKDVGAEVVPLQAQITGSAQPVLYLLFGAVALILLIACANVSNLLLARSSARRRELAVRAALGAGGRRLLRQLLTESLLLSASGGLAGLLLAKFSLHLLAVLRPAELPSGVQITLDGHVLLFALGAALLAGIIFGTIPAAQASRPNLNECLKASARTVAGGSKKLRSGLVVAEVGLSVVLLMAAGLIIKSLALLYRADPGFNPEKLAVMEPSLPAIGESMEQHAVHFYTSLLEAVRTTPGVLAAGAVNPLPLAGGLDWGGWIEIEGRPAAGPGEHLYAAYRLATPGYFSAMQIPILTGRDFDQHDNDRAPAVAVINQAMTRQFWPGTDALGKRLNICGLTGNREWLTIVGIVGDVKSQSVEGNAEPEVYVPYSYYPAWVPYMSLTVRTAGDPQQLALVFEREVRQIDPAVPVRFRAMPQILRESEASPRVRALLFGIFAVLALVLAMIGAYGVISYGASERSHEIGIRMALGARRVDVLRSVLKQGLLLIGIGAAIGIVGSLAATHLVSSFLYDVYPNDPLVFAIVPSAVAAVAMLACYIPAQRAATVDPITVLRHE